ncbi:MAG: tannase/feruloyl esterase family alpha/beta hydrolase [Porticoccaceae bacterium]|jgi:feruloyl esterase|nr:tannase/feruloyl esterase family alpha/beta hydrolase [Porticoccaceae bacterium]MEA3301159.1 tannase/feruloyl esterase family alpha/beta hydrolase [Pseudomonadota bacterium]
MNNTHAHTHSRLAVALLAALGASGALARGECTLDAIRAIAPGDTVIDSVEALPSPVPHCKIDGHIITTNPGPNQVNFRLQLPDDNWTKRFYFIGLGGSAGYVPTDSQIPAGNPLRAGFAVAGTDTGRQGSAGDWNFLSESPAKALDHNHRGAHVTTVAAQAITRAYYGSDELYRYTSGCSGGGRMATQAIENYPGDYDGVILGAPGGRSSGSMLKFIHAAQQMYREPGAWLSPAKLAMVDGKVTAACDGSDGVIDGVVADHRLCDFDVASLKCPAGDGTDCLTQPEITSIKAILDGPRGPDGKLLAQPMQITNMTMWSQFLGQTPPPWSTEPSRENAMRASAGFTMSTSLAHAFFGKDYDVLKFDFNNQRHIDDWWAAARRTGFGMPYSADLKGFYEAGGKVILWNGRSDSCCGDLELEQYYLDAGRSVGDAAKLDEFARLYQIPGMGHCGSGTGPLDAPDQFIRAMVDWVEKDVPPGPVVAHRGDERARLIFADPKTGQVSGVVIPPPVGEPRDFLLCPYPRIAVFNPAAGHDKGAVYDARNWLCRAP